MVTLNRAACLALVAVALGASGCDALLVVHGRVVNPAGVPVTNARIGTNPYDKRVVQSDENGCFKLVNVCSPTPGTVPLLVSASGYRPLAGAVEAPGDRQIKVVIRPDGAAGEGEITRDSSPGVCAATPPLRTP